MHFFLIFSIFSFLSPIIAHASDANGYQAQYEVAVNLPGCNGGITGNGVKIIENNDDWSEINNSAYTVFCVVPGDYRGAGKIVFTSSGSEAHKRYLRWYDKNSQDLTTHPVKMASTKQAIIKQFEFNGGNYWVLDRLVIKGFTTGNNLSPQANSDYNTFNRLLFEGNDLTPGNGIFQIRGGNNYNVLQNSVLRNCSMQANLDTNGVRLYHGADYNRIVNNEIYNCTDQVVLVDETNRTRGTVIENNDLYVTSAMYSDGNGNKVSNGNYSCSENGVDTKAAWDGADPADATLILHNRFWGFKPGDDACGGSGDPAGSALNVHFNGDYVVVQNNIFYSNGNAITFPNAGANNARVIGNLIYNTSSPVAGNGKAITFSKASNSVIYANTIVNAQTYAVQGGSNKFHCNLIINGGSSSGSLPDNDRSYNAFYNTTSSGEADSINLPSVADAKMDSTPYCFFRKLQTSPESVCLDNVRPTTQSPHYAYCPESLVN
jgi:hypothetical protein